MHDKDIATPGVSCCTAGRTAGRTHEASEGGFHDPDLAALVAAWPSLPGAIRAGILAMVRAAGG
jgi:hypothetical protein